LRLFSYGGYGLALAALALAVFGAIECPPYSQFPTVELPDLLEFKCNLKAAN